MLLLALATGMASFAQPRPSTTVSQRYVGNAVGKLSLAFEPNRGQAPAEVKFIAHSGSKSVFLTTSGATLSLAGAPGERVALRLKLLGANIAAETRGFDPLPGQTSYFVGDDPTKWRAAVPQYSRVQFRDVYKGIDLAYYGQQRELEYDFLVAPGADPRAIHLAVEGARRLHLEASGDVVITTAAGQLRKRRPRIYQLVDGVARKVSGRFIVHGRVLSFTLGHYDRSLPLVIDPTITLEFAALLGGSGDEIAFGVATDSSGNVYTTGSTTSTDFPTTTGVLQPVNGAGAQQVFVAKFDSTLSKLLYSTYLGGSGSQTGRGIAVDSSGNAYIAGYTNSANFPTTSGALQIAFGGGTCSGVPCNDAFITKLNPTGSALLYSTYFGGNNVDQAQAMALDTSGNVYITGITASTNLPTTRGVVQPQFGGVADAFLMKLNPQGTKMVYSTYLGGNNVDLGNGLAIDAAGNAYVVGDTFSTNFPTTAGVLQPKAKGGTCGSNPCDDAFVTKVNPAGTGLVYSTYLGGSNSDFAQGVALDANGGAWVIGTTSSTDFPTTPGVVQPNYGGGSSDAFSTALDPFGQTLLTSTYIGGTGAEFGEAIALSSQGPVVLSVDTASINFPANPQALARPVSHQANELGFTDFLIVALDPGQTTDLGFVRDRSEPPSGASIGSSLAAVAAWTYTRDNAENFYFVGVADGTGNPAGKTTAGQDSLLADFIFTPPVYSLALTKTVAAMNPAESPQPGSDVYFAGQSLKYTLTLTNTGTEEVTVLVIDKLDSATMPASAVVEYVDTQFCPNSSGHFPFVENAPLGFDCRFPIDAGQTFTFDYDVKLQTPGQWTNTAVASFAGRDATASTSVSILQNFTSVSGASFQTGLPLAPNLIATGFGTGLSIDTGAASTSPPPTKLAGTSVMVAGGSSPSPQAVAGRAATAVAAPLLYVSPNQINYVIPSGTPTGTATVTVVNDTLGTVANGTLQIAAVAPGLFSIDGSGPGVAAAQAVRTSAGGTETSVTVFQCGGAAGTCVAVPIDLGPPTDTVTLVLYGTGIRGFSNIANVTASIGTGSAPVLSAGPQGTFAGLDQVNVQLPRTLIGSGKVNVVLTVDGQTSNTVTINVQ